jgi:hypothetical protein
VTAGVRTDLLALDADTLAAMSNKGLVKRAQKDLDAGIRPVLAPVGGEAGAAGPDGGDPVCGRFPDGAEAQVPPGAGLDASTCTCGAATVCRHRVGLVLAYQEANHDLAAPGGAAKPPAAPLPWSPGSVGDEALAALVGPRALAAARRVFERGYPVRVHRATGAPERDRDGVPWVELPACTVRFPVPGAAAHALTDAVPERRGEVIALAVWAFRAADETGHADAEIRLDVGGPVRAVRPAGATPPPPAASPSRLTSALDLTRELLVDGAANASPVLVATLRRTRRDLDDAALRWPAVILGELADQLDAYRERHAGYQSTLLARAVAELHARHAAAGHGAIAASEALGTGEAEAVPLRRIRLTALGARIGAAGAERTARVYFAQPEAGITLVLTRRWRLDPHHWEDPARANGHALSGRRILGAPLASLAASNLVSETASRSASRTLTVAASRIAPSSVVPLGSAWRDLPAPIMLRDLRPVAAALAARAPQFLRPRVEAETVHVVPIAEVTGLGYDAGQQRLRATIRDEHGAGATILADYDPVCPAALDALAAALEDGPRYISGALRLANGGVVIDPIAVLTGDGLVIPDFAAGTAGAALAAGPDPAADPIADGLDAAVRTLAELAHLGLRDGVRAQAAPIEADAAHLARIGLAACAERLRRIPGAAAREGHAAAAVCWIDAFIHLMVAGEQAASRSWS